MLLSGCRCRYGIDIRVYFNDDARIEAVEHDEAVGSAKLSWKSEDGAEGAPLELMPFAVVSP